MKKYKVLSSLIVFTIENKEYTLKKDDTVDLPEDNNVTQALLARKQIALEEEAASEASTDNSKKFKK